MTEADTPLDLTEDELVEILCGVSRPGRQIDAGSLHLIHLDTTSDAWAVLGPDGESHITVLNISAFKDTAELRAHLRAIATNRTVDSEELTFDSGAIPSSTNPQLQTQ